MKKKILEKLKEKFAGVSETILDRVAGKLASTVTEDAQIQDAVDKVTVQSLLESYGDSRANEAQQSAVKNYEKKYGLKDGKKEKEENEDGNEEAHDHGNEEAHDHGNEDMPAWAKAIVEANKQLTSELNELKTSKITGDRRTKLNKLTEALPESIKAAYGRTNVESLTDEEFGKLQDDIKKEVESITSELGSNKSVFGVPLSKSHTSTKTGKEATDEEVEAVVKKLNI